MDGLSCTASRSEHKPYLYPDTRSEGLTVEHQLAQLAALPQPFERVRVVLERDRCLDGHRDAPSATRRTASAKSDRSFIEAPITSSWRQNSVGSGNSAVRPVVEPFVTSRPPLASERKGSLEGGGAHVVDHHVHPASSGGRADLLVVGACRVEHRFSAVFDRPCPGLPPSARLRTAAPQEIGPRGRPPPRCRRPPRRPARDCPPRSGRGAPSARLRTRRARRLAA